MSVRGEDESVLPSHVTEVDGHVLVFVLRRKPAWRRRCEAKWRANIRKWGSSWASKMSSRYCQERRSVRLPRGRSTSAM